MPTIHITTEPIDNDLAVQINGLWAHNPKFIHPINGLGSRSATVRANIWANVRLYAYDESLDGRFGFEPGNWQTNTWRAVVHYDNGTTRTYTGGVLASGKSISEITGTGYQFKYRDLGNFQIEPPPVIPPTVIPPPPVIPPSDPRIYGNPWPAVRPFAREGAWVRRLGWPPLRKLTYTSGAGTARAIAIIEDIAGLRVVQAQDFGVIEFAATDWIVLDNIPGAGTPPPPPGDTAAVVPPPPPAGQWVQVSDNGLIRWVPLAPFACPV